MNVRILFVEDSPDDAELLLRRLRGAGIEPHWERVETEAELREAVASERWELALVDFNMPGFGGPRALAVLAEMAPDLPAITVSGAISEDTAVATITAGAVDYVLKDNLARLAPAVQHAVEGADLRRREREAAEAARVALHLVDRASLAILRVVEDGTIVYANERACALGGHARDHFVGAKVWDLHIAQSPSQWAAYWAETKQLGARDYETAVAMANGDVRHLAVSANYVDYGSQSFLVSYSRDVTDRHVAEERARASDAMYRRIVDLAGEGIWMFDRADKVTFANPQMARMLGYEVDDMIGRVDSDFMFAEDAALHEAERRARRKGLPGEFERRFRSKDGSDVWLAISSVADLDSDGGYAGAFAMCTDVTERHLAEDALRESEERHRVIFEKNRAIKLIIDPETAAIVDANQAACEFYGYRRDELLALKVSDLNTAPPEAVRRAMDRAAGGQTSFVFQHRLASGDVRDVEVNTGPFETGGRTLLFSVVHDISQRKRAEDSLRESEERFEQFADHFPGYLFMQDEERRYVYVNRRDLKDGDVPREDWFGKTPTQVWEGEDAARSEAEVQRALDGEVVDVIEPWMPTGMHEYLHSVYFPIAREGKQLLVGGISIDVTAQVEAQDEVRRQAEQLRRTVEGAVLAMSNVVETRDPYTAGHERRVSELATAIAAQMGMAGAQLDGLRLAGLIHDIGKVAVPAEILAKPGRLSAVEFNLIKQHPESGFEILAAIDFGRPVAEMVLQHHERLDGSGYPRALSGADIMPEARILAVADVVEAMSSHRPYRPALGMAAALAEVREHAGLTYDAGVVAACVRLVEEQGFAFTQ